MKTKKKADIPRQKWSEEEVAEIRKLFKASFEHDKTPRQAEVEKQMKISAANKGLIHKRPRDNIKKKVSTMLMTVRKMQK